MQDYREADEKIKAALQEDTEMCLEPIKDKLTFFAREW